MHDWFGLGSRIIITTRDQHLLVRHGVDNVHMVDGLSHEEALQLFCRKAFRKGHPTDGYLELSLQMVSYAAGLPLALEVLGSFLFGRSEAEWKDALDRLKKFPDRRIFEILKISYDGLQELEKKIFLDVACFFKGRDKDEIREILYSCDFHPDIGISVLIDKCIITLSNNSLCMHDLIQYMGWEIVRPECPEKPGQRSRLWLSNDIHRILTKNEAVEGIILDFPAYKELKLNAKSFSRMNNLRLLKIKDVSLSQSLEYISDELRLLNWHGYPLRSLPSNFQHNKLFELNMCSSHIEQLWKEVKHSNQLKIVILSHSTRLTQTPDFTGAPNLERLILDGCTSLSFVHPSIGLLKRLILLNLKDCKQLRSLRAKIEWESLEVLILSGCSKLSNVREIMSNTKHLAMLKVLDLNGCSKLVKLPEDLEHLAILKNLDLGGAAIN
ncbi:hypothetical protein Patl1_07255 [Pistacia atlantica]|uniref:Uncharacterized protein n=1 Tax=Pistacia atlantica TaxID=434234 RepID=A0ACC1AG47_9ROSI|nr:hypothetical protein Patl1_07255 [Pistacia atlantica]